MAYPQVMPLDRALDRPAVSLPNNYSGAATDEHAWKAATYRWLRIGEGIGWVVALGLNVAASGWVGFGLWSVMFGLAITLETAAQPVTN